VARRIKDKLGIGSSAEMAQRATRWVETGRSSDPGPRVLPPVCSRFVRPRLARRQGLSGEEMCPVDMLWIFYENPKHIMLYRRSIEPNLKRHLDRGKSVLLLGPRHSSPRRSGSATRKNPRCWPAKSGLCLDRFRAANGPL